MTLQYHEAEQCLGISKKNSILFTIFFHGKYIQLYSKFSKLLVYMCIDKACFAYLGNSISKKENPQN